MLVFDTHIYIKKLEAAGVPAQQAEVQAETLKEILENDLATKHDLQELAAKLEVKIEHTKAELIKWLIGLLLALFFAQTGLMITLVNLLRSLP